MHVRDELNCARVLLSDILLVVELEIGMLPSFDEVSGPGIVEQFTH